MEKEDNELLLEQILSIIEENNKRLKVKIQKNY